MSDQLKFFSQEWCDAATKAVNNNEDVVKGFKDANSFTNKMAFRTSDGPTSTLEWDKGKVASWTAGAADDSELWIVLEGNLDTWKACAGGEAGSTLLMQGKIKFSKGPMSAAIENAGAFNNFLATWGGVPTDWNA